MPTQIYRLYKHGIFEQSFSFGELRFMLRIFLVMHVVNCGGHLLMKQWTKPVFDKHIRVDEDRTSKKREMDDYIT